MRISDSTIHKTDQGFGHVVEKVSGTIIEIICPLNCFRLGRRILVVAARAAPNAGMIATPPG
jgi:hypothetical protein